MKKIYQKFLASLVLLTLFLGLLSPAFVTTTNASESESTTVTSPDELTEWTTEGMQFEIPGNSDNMYPTDAITVQKGVSTAYYVAGGHESDVSLKDSVFKATVQLGETEEGVAANEYNAGLLFALGHGASGLTIEGKANGNLAFYYMEGWATASAVTTITPESVESESPLTGRELQLMITTEFVNISQDGTTTDLNVGIYIDGKLFNDGYIKLEKIPTQYLTQNICGHSWNNPEYIHISAPKEIVTPPEEEDGGITSPEKLTEWTTNKWPLQVGSTYPGHQLTVEKGVSTSYHVANGYESTDSLDDSVFKATVQLGKTPAGVASGEYGAGVKFALGNLGSGLTIEGKPNGNLAFYYMSGWETKSSITTITPASVESELPLTGRELQLMVTTEFVNTSQDGTTTDINVGVYINGQLFEDRYIVMEGIPTQYLTQNINGHNWDDKEYIHISVPKEIITSPDQLTTWTTNKWPLQVGSTYPGHQLTVEKGVSTSYHVASGYESTDSLNDSVFRATVQLGATAEGVASGEYGAGVKFALGNLGSGLTIEGKPNGNLAFYYMSGWETKSSVTTITPASVDSELSLTGRELQIMVTTEFENTSSDGATTDINVGIYINGELFENRYIVMEGIPTQYLTQNINGHNWDDKEYIHISAPKEVITSPDKLTSWTFQDVWLGSGPLKFTNTYLWTIGEQQIKTLDQKVFTTDIQFVTDASSLGTQDWGQEYVRIVLGSGFEDVGLVIDAVQGGGIRLLYCDAQYKTRNLGELTPEDFNWTADETFIDDKITLQVTTEFFNTDLEEATTDVKVGIYVNGVLGTGRYLVVEDASLTALVQNFSAQIYGKTSETMTLWIPEDYQKTYAVKEPVAATAKGWDLSHYVVDEATLEETPVLAKHHINVDANRLQGMAIYNDTVFQAYNSGLVETYDLKTGKLFELFELGGATGDSTYHAGQMNFGVEFPEGNTEYPALYVGSSATLGKTFVQNITKESAELIQIIDYAGVTIGKLGSGAYIDTERQRLICLANAFAGQNKLNSYTVVEFELPALTDGVMNEEGVLVVSLTDEDILKTYMLGYVPSILQSGLIYNGRIMGIHGNYLDALGNNMALVNYEVGTGSFDRYINLSGQINGGNQEPQAISVYENELYACFAGGRLYKVNMNWDVPKTDYNIAYDYSLDTVKENIKTAVQTAVGAELTVGDVALPSDFTITQDAQAFTAKVALTNAYWVDAVSISGTINGKLDDETIATIDGSTLVLDGTLQANITTTLVAEKTDGRKISLKVTMPDGAAQTLIADNTAIVDNTYEFTFGVAAKQMTDVITLQLYCDERLCDSEEYSVQTYANTIINGDYDQTAKELAQALLNYGTAAQSYFKYNTSNLANPSLMPNTDFAEVTADTLVAYKKGSQFNDGIGKLTSTNLVLESETTLKLYFTLAEGVSVGDLAFKDGQGNELEVAQSGSRYYVTFKNIKAHQLGEDVTVNISTEDESVSHSYTYSVLSYCYVALNYDGASEALTNLAKALYLYNQAAVAYLNN